MQNWLLVFHLFGLVLWAGSLLSLTRFMAWRGTQPSIPTEAAKAFEKKLMFGGAHAGMGIVLLTGFWMLVQQEWGPVIPSVSGGGFHIKLTFVFLLMVLTFVAQVRVLKNVGDASKQPKVLALLTILAVVGALISVYVFYPQMRAKKQQQPAASEASAAVQPVESSIGV